MYAPIPAAIPGAAAGAAAIWLAHAPTHINLTKCTCWCILNIDRTLKWFSYDSIGLVQRIHLNFVYDR